MLKIRLYLIIAVCAALLGCSSDKATEAQNTTKPDKEPAAGKNAESKESGTDLSKAQPGEPGDKGESKPSQALSIPNTLNTQVADYFGMKEYSKSDYEFASAQGSPYELTRELKLLSSSDKEIVVEETASSAAGDQKFEHVLNKDGVYSRQVRQDGTKSELQLALPSELALGKKWQTKTTVEVGGKAVQVTSSSKIVGFEKVTVGGKTYDALKLREEASLKGDNPEVWKTTTWLAKGVGLVKMEIDRTPKGQPSVKSTMTIKSGG